MASLLCSLSDPHSLILGSPTYLSEPSFPIVSPMYPHQPLSLPLPPTPKRPLPLPSTPGPPAFNTTHMVHPKPPSPAGRWGVDGWGAPEMSFLSPPLLSSPDWDTVRNLKQLEEAAALNGMGGGGFFSCFLTSVQWGRRSGLQSPTPPPGTEGQSVPLW